MKKEYINVNTYKDKERIYKCWKQTMKKKEYITWDNRQ